MSQKVDFNQKIKAIDGTLACHKRTDLLTSGGEEAITTQTNPVNWFEIPVNDLDRARQFYETVFGFQLSLHEMDSLKMAWFPMTQGIPGATGTLVQSEWYTPSHAGTLVYFSVPDIDDTLAAVNAHGGKTLMPKTGIGEYGYIAHFEDSEGNRVALHSMT